MKRCREHPVTIFRHAITNIWLLIFPLLRGIRSFSMDFGTFYTRVKGAWFDLIFVLIIVAVGYFRWLFTFCRMGRHHIRRDTGIFIKTVTSVSYKSISAVTVERSFYLRPFKAVRLNIDTCAGPHSSTDLSFIIRSSDLKELKKHFPKVTMKGSGRVQFRSRPFTIVFFSLIFSSSLSGVIYLGTIIFQAGRIIRSAMNEGLPQVYEIANNVSADVSDKVPMEVPPVAVILIFLLVGTWIFSFAANILRYTGFRLKKTNGMIRVVSGALTKRSVHISPDRINYIDIRQNLLMKICRRSSIHVNCPGYGKKRYEQPVLLPVLNKDQENRMLRVLRFDQYVTKRTIKPEPLAFWSYFSIPTYFLAGVPAAAHIIAHFFPQIGHILKFAVIMVEIPLVWLIVVKIAAFFTTGITLEGDFLCIKYSRFYAFHTVLVDKNKLVKIQTFQDLIDKKFGRARLDFYFSSNRTIINKVKGLKAKDAEKFIEMIKYSEK